MAEQRKQIENALRACAETGVPDKVDLWPRVRERATVNPHRSRRFRIVPRTRVGLIFALLLVALFTMGAYAGSKWVFEVFQSELPGGNAAELGEKLYLTQTMDDATATIEWAYADETRVVIGFSVEDLKHRKDYENDAELQPYLGSGPPKSLPPNLGDLTDDSGGDFRIVDGTTFVSMNGGLLRGPVANTVVFAAPKGLNAGEKHQFRFTLPFEEMPIFPRGATSVRDEPDPLVGPFVFDFEIPVHSVGVVEMDRKIQSNGTTLTLDKVVQSPGRPQAILCFTPPDERHDWMPIMDNGLLPFDLREGYLETRPVDGINSGCWSVAMPEYSDHYSFTVDYLEGMPPGTGDPWPKVRGPWKFDFEVPDQ